MSGPFQRAIDITVDALRERMEDRRAELALLRDVEAAARDRVRDPSQHRVECRFFRAKGATLDACHCDMLAIVNALSALDAFRAKEEK